MIVDDHPMLREGLEVMLNARKIFKVVHAAADGEEAVEWVRKNGCPQVIVSDVRMPKMDGFAFLAKLQRFYPKARVVMLAGMPLKEETEKARAARARGYLSKSDDTDKLAEVLKAVAADEIDFAADDFKPAPSILSPREFEVLTLVAKGLQRDAIAARLFISPETVKSRLKSVMMKLDVSNSASAVSRAYELGILRA